eukprot:2407574-Alexandrium_andersonii.AAC.1
MFRPLEVDVSAPEIKCSTAGRNFNLKGRKVNLGRSKHRPPRSKSVAPEVDFSPPPPGVRAENIDLRNLIAKLCNFQVGFLVGQFPRSVCNS